MFVLAGLVGGAYVLYGVTGGNAIASTIGGAIMGNLAIMAGFAQLIRVRGQMQVEALERIVAELQGTRLREHLERTIE